MKDPGPCVVTPATSRINGVENSADCIIHRQTRQELSFPRTRSKRLQPRPDAPRAHLRTRASSAMRALREGGVALHPRGLRASIFAVDHEARGDRAARRPPRPRPTREGGGGPRRRQVSSTPRGRRRGPSCLDLDDAPPLGRSSPNFIAAILRRGPQRRAPCAAGAAADDGCAATGRARRGTGPPRSCGKRSAREGPCGRARRRRTSAWRYRWCSMSYGTARRAPGGCPRNGRARRWTSSTGRLAGGPYGTTGRQIQTPWTPACRFVCTR